MALNTLIGVKEIGGFPVFHAKDHTDFIQSEPIVIWINHKSNEITFKIQDGPIGESGVNGCQVVTMIQAAKLIFEKLNGNFPSRFNEISIEALDVCIMSQNQRTFDREERNVEGKSEL